MPPGPCVNLVKHRETCAKKMCETSRPPRHILWPSIGMSQTEVGRRLPLGEPRSRSESASEDGTEVPSSVEARASAACRGRLARAARCGPRSRSTGQAGTCRASASRGRARAFVRRISRARGGRRIFAPCRHRPSTPIAVGIASFQHSALVLVKRRWRVAAAGCAGMAGGRWRLAGPDACGLSERFSARLSRVRCVCVASPWTV